jgi:hypothetical protein
LDLAVHPNTSDIEVINAINGFRRLVKGQSVSIIAKLLFGNDSRREEEWQELFTTQELEINRLRNENRRLQKALAETKKRRNLEEKIVVNYNKKYPRNMSLTDDEWNKIVHLIPKQYRTDKNRDKISVAIIVLKTKCGWRIMSTHEKPNRWANYYNFWRNNLRHFSWWNEVMRTVDCG